MKGLIVMLSLFTRIPLRPKFEIDGAVFARGIKWLPLVALLIGVPVGALFALQSWTGPYLAAFVALAAYLLISGGLHVDGFADTLDALGSRRDREGMLAIMKDSRIGSFGALGIGLYIAGMLVCLAGADWRFAALLPLAGRTAALLCAVLFPYARPEGMGRGFVESVRWGHVALSLGVYLAAAALLSCGVSPWALDGHRFMVLCLPLVAALGVTAGVAAGIAKKLGGITGDVVGFGIELSQLVYLLGAALLLRLV